MLNKDQLDKLLFFFKKKKRLITKLQNIYIRTVAIQTISSSHAQW